MNNLIHHIFIFFIFFHIQYPQYRFYNIKYKIATTRGCTRRLERRFRELSREVDACRGDLFAHAVSDLGRHAATSFSTDALLDGLYASQTVAEDQFKLAMTSLMCQLRLCLNVAVAQNR